MMFNSTSYGWLGKREQQKTSTIRIKGFSCEIDGLLTTLNPYDGLLGRQHDRRQLSLYWHMYGIYIAGGNEKWLNMQTSTVVCSNISLYGIVTILISKYTFLQRVKMKRSPLWLVLTHLPCHSYSYFCCCCGRAGLVERCICPNIHTLHNLL